ncbi:hypothetical protein LOTGIDRAFT_234405 [Lottia gigantea]|uniref:Chitin-binding type-2 domain-containing protein n=1 Tax=Lottia gigantea TaxID=225164 RepID=V4A1M0_LOTGI|nr:hypothetical protein LOTGIDRAFT_234405 [Lottia gigantea]ESO88820.1 hypothetical protein LOTGIDRAFT_234405 [Lottia gigantea]
MCSISLSVFAVIVIGSCTVIESFTPHCTSSFGWIRNPNNCSEFWRCDFGKPIPMVPCPSGLILNNQLHVCVRRGGQYDDCDQGPSNKKTVAERCSAGEQLIPHESECQLYYNCSLFYDFVPRYFEQYLDECRYPNLFDSTTLSCRPYKDVKCGRLVEHVSPCEYRRGKCGTSHCQPCVATCTGKSNGRHSHENREWSPFYVICNDQRTIKVDTCSKDETLNIARLFSPITNKCEPLYRIPQSRGGLAPACVQNGLFPDQGGRCDIFIRCENGVVAEVVKCPSNFVFDPDTQNCRSDTEFCGTCGRLCKDLP